jgi:hypothetical protein
MPERIDNALIGKNAIGRGKLAAQFSKRVRH